MTYAISITHSLQAMSSLPVIKFMRRSKPAPSKHAVAKAGNSKLSAGLIANTAWRHVK